MIWYKSHGRQMETSDDEDLASKLKADGWSDEKPDDVIEDIPAFVQPAVVSEYPEEGEVVTVSDD